MGILRAAVSKTTLFETLEVFASIERVDAEAPQRRLGVKLDPGNKQAVQGVYVAVPQEVDHAQVEEGTFSLGVSTRLAGCGSSLDKPSSKASLKITSDPVVATLWRSAGASESGSRV